MPCMLECLWLTPSAPLLQVAADEESAPDIASLEPEEDMTLLDKKLVDKNGELGGLDQCPPQLHTSLSGLVMGMWRSCAQGQNSSLKRTSMQSCPTAGGGLPSSGCQWCCRGGTAGRKAQEILLEQG